MPRKRDYKKEYQAAKKRAKESGYRSEREYKAVRKAYGKRVSKAEIEQSDPGAASRAVKRANRAARLRRDARKWSADHSRQIRSQYQRKWGDDTAESYYQAYVANLPEDEKQEALRQFLVEDTELVEPEEWESLYVGD